jgi:hypothetical protein
MHPSRRSLSVVRKEKRGKNYVMKIMVCLGATGPSAHAMGAGSSWEQRVSISPAVVNSDLVKWQIVVKFVGATFYIEEKSKWRQRDEFCSRCPASATY